MSSRYVFTPSPFLGVTAVRAIAARMPDSIAADYGGVSGPNWYAGMAQRLASQVEGRPWVAVLHSGAGGFAPAVAAVSADLAGFIFIDAVLPYPGRRWVDTAPALLVAHLRRMAREGMLPPWNLWFESDPTPPLLTDPDVRQAFLADLPRVPLAYLDAICPPDAGWRRLPAAYIRLSSAYDEEATEAERRGWPVRRVPMHHLAIVSDPTSVARLVAELPNGLIAA